MPPAAAAKPAERKKSPFEILQAIDVSEHIEKKVIGGTSLSYLSWAWAWAKVKELFPDSFYTVYERETETGPVNYFTDGRTCWVKTGFTLVDGDKAQEIIECLPVNINCRKYGDPAVCNKSDCPSWTWALHLRRRGFASGNTGRQRQSACAHQ